MRVNFNQPIIQPSDTKKVLDNVKPQEKTIIVYN